MAFQVSPGINVSEIDLTASIPAISVSTGAIAGAFKWGPALEIVRVSSETELVSRFGAPDNDTANVFFTAASFLAYSNDLLVTRAISTTTSNNAVGSANLKTVTALSGTANTGGTRALTGTVDISNTSTTVTGSGTFFQTQLVAGDEITVNAVIKTVATIISNTSLTVNTVFSEVLTGASADATYPATAVIGTATAFNSDLAVNDFIRINSEDKRVTNVQSATLLRVNTAFTSATAQTVSELVAVTPGRVLLENTSDYAASPEYQGTSTANGSFAARYAGNKGNSLLVSICPSAAAFANWTYKSLFDSAPGTSDFVDGKNGADDELHVVVVDAGGLFTGTPGATLERFGYLSKASDARTDDGSTNYYKEVLYNKSQYVYWVGHPATGTGSTDASNWGDAALNTTFGAGDVVTVRLGNGADGTISTGQLQTAYELYEDVQNIDLSLLIAADGHDKGVAGTLLDIAESRKDCVAFISPTYEDTILDTDPTDSISGTANGLASRNSYGVHDSGWKYMYDKYNDKYRWVPLNGDIAGLCARTDRERDPWFSPAGFQRGAIKNVVKLAYNPNQTQRDTLYKAGVNPVVSLPGEGTVLFGDKTLSIKPSSFDRINVRRLFIVLEKAIARAARASLFEFNDEFTRAQFVSLVEPFLRTVQGRRGIYDFRVVCDETNNTAAVIDANQFVGDIYIKPARSINFVQLNFVAVRTGVEFNEIVGKF